MRKPKLEEILNGELIQLADQELIISLIRERASKFEVLNLNAIHGIGFAQSKLIEDFASRNLPPGRTRLSLLIGLITDFYRERETGPVLGDLDYPGLIQIKILEDGKEILIYEIKTDQ